MSKYFVAAVSLCAWGLHCATTCALPPLGLTPIGPFRGASVEIIQESANITVPGGVRIVDPEGEVEAIALMHPEFGAPDGVTRVIQSADGHEYVGANFLGDLPGIYDPIAAALFRLDAPTAPVVTWHRDSTTGERPDIVGIDETVRGVGQTIIRTIDGLGNSDRPAEFFLDGTVVPFEVPVHPDDGTPIQAYVTDVSGSGYAVGGGTFPGSFGTQPIVLTPEGDLSFLPTAGEARSVRDRLDGGGINIGMGFGSEIKYGDEPLLYVDVGGPSFEQSALVSQSDLVVINMGDERPFAYYSGLVPGEPRRGLPIDEVFPELASVNFDRITDLAAVDGRIYMTLAAEDGLYLFGARDPSVIPEPSAVVLAVFLLGALGGCRKTLFRPRSAMPMSR